MLNIFKKKDKNNDSDSEFRRDSVERDFSRRINDLEKKMLENEARIFEIEHPNGVIRRTVNPRRLDPKEKMIEIEYCYCAYYGAKKKIENVLLYYGKKNEFNDDIAYIPLESLLTIERLNYRSVAISWNSSVDIGDKTRTIIIDTLENKWIYLPNNYILTKKEEDKNEESN